MSYHGEEYSEKEREQAGRFFLILFGVFLICSVFINKKLPIQSNFVLITGTLIQDVKISTGGKSKFNYFEFQLKEDIYKKAQFRAHAIFYGIDRQRIRTSLKKDTIVSFYTSKDKFETNFLVQKNDIYGPKKLGKCRLEPVSILINGESIYSFEDYIEYMKKDRFFGKIIFPLIGTMMIAGGLYKDRLTKFCEKNELLIALIVLLVSFTIFVVIQFLL